MKSILTGLAAMVLALAVGGAAQAGDWHDKDQDKKDHNKDKDKKDENKDKGKKEDGTSKLKDQVVSLLKDQIDRDAAQAGLASQKLAMDILPANLGGHPERVAADQAQLATSVEKLDKDKALLAKALSDPSKK